MKTRLLALWVFTQCGLVPGCIAGGEEGRIISLSERSGLSKIEIVAKGIE